jgi:hypothetical protein
MKKFLAIYTGTETSREKSGWDQLDAETRQAKESAGIQAWMGWGVTNAAAILDQGGPLGKTKRTAPDGVSDIKNHMVAYVILEAEDHEAAARMFLNHPHFSIFPGEAVEIMECLPIPGM